ncbi:MAG: hypothetical protein EZS28_016617 [Streblomastix strix]|uniref:Uncharacterized protein n=1 Tax=Streblomastix strix TaxID=222440 RepID=A0A5J4VYZ1_9EUKA|nr:MAG: hypothetical protein EZS28_016617 [Streblomastix strix]
MTQLCDQNAQALFTNLIDGADLNMTPNQPLTDDRDTNGNYTNMFASDREITVIDTDVGSTLRTSSTQKILFFIIRFMELLTGRNADDKTCRSTTAQNLEQRLEQPSRRIHLEFIVSNSDVIYASDTFDSTFTEKEHERDKEVRTQVTRKVANTSQQRWDRTIDSKAGNVYTCQDYTIISLGTAETKIIDIINVPVIYRVPRNTTISRISITRQSSFIEGLPQFMQNPPAFGMQQTQQSSTLTLPAPSSLGHPTFQPPALVQQQQNRVQEHSYVNGVLIDSPEIALTRRIAQDQQSLWKKEKSQRIDQSLFCPEALQKLLINMNQQQFITHRDFSVYRSYSLRYLGSKANGKHHRGIKQGLQNVSAFIQRHARQVHITVNDWKAFCREVDTDFYINTVRRELNEDDNNHQHYDHEHDHDHSHIHNIERKYRKDQFDL